MPVPSVRRRLPRRLTPAGWWLAALLAPVVGRAEPLADVAHLVEWAIAGAATNRAFRLAGTLCVPTPENGRIVLQDASGTLVFLADWRHPALSSGTRVQVEGATGLPGSLRFGEYGFLRLTNQPARLVVLGEGAGPRPRSLAVAQALPAETAPQWSEVEGELTLWFNSSGQSLLELTSPGGHMSLRVGEGQWEPPAYLWRSRIRVTGLAQSRRNADGTLVAATLWAPDARLLEPRELAPGTWENYGLRTINYLGRTSSLGPEGEIVHVRGEVRTVTGDHSFVLEDETGAVPAETILPIPQTGVGQWELLGRWQGVGTNVALRDAIFRERPDAAGEPPGALPTLTLAAQVRQLSRAEARRGYPVRLRGIVVWVADGFGSLILQDATRAIYLRHRGAWGAVRPKVGDDWEIQGVSDPADFSPIVEARSAVRHGLGRLPEPIHPTWDQLVNGSLDAQYVELEGIISGARSHTVSFITHGGKLRVALPEIPPDLLRSSENAIVRLRGCLFADWNAATHQVRIARNIRLGNASLMVVEPPPANPFAAARKSVNELLLFDAQAGALQKVRVAGQVVHAAGDLVCLMEGTNGIRFLPREPVHFAPGDTVEVVGFPDWSGSAPMLREAVARKTGQAPLPEPRRLLPASALSHGYDATLVRVAGRLFNVRNTPQELALEVQDGSGTLVARLRKGGAAIPELVTGSWLDLTGVYAAQGGGRLEGREITAFELLLNSPADIQVLSQPGWWTLGRLFTAVGVLLAGLVAAFAWITQLRRQVERRTRQLRAETRERERAEQLRAVEAERARIARDLHDDLGSSLTEIGMLASASPGGTLAPDRARERLAVIAGKSRSLIHALDEIVWAVNPRHDTLGSLANYLASYVDEYLAPTPISHRTQIPPALPDTLVPAEIRHDLFLAVKEALSNAVRHAHATEILFRLIVTPAAMEIQVIDNGCGFGSVTSHSGNGIRNLSERMRNLNGECRIESRAGHGTTVALRLPLSPSAPPPVP